MEREEFCRRVAMLSPRLVEALILVAEGNSNRQISLRLSAKSAQSEGAHLREATVKRYVEEVLHVLGVSGRTEAAVLWTKFGDG